MTKQVLSVGSDLDAKVREHFLHTGELLPEVREMRPDLIEELIGRNMPEALNNLLREQMRQG